MTDDPIPTLDDLAFEGRNKDYGAYFLRKRYGRYLFYGMCLGILLLFLVVGSSWAYYYFKPINLVEGDILYEMEYYSVMPQPDQESADIAKAYAKKPEVPDVAPVVADTVKQEMKPDEERVEPEPEEPEKIRTDTAASAGGSGHGEGIGDDTGLASAVDVYPRFPGGDAARLTFLRRNVRYPEPALKSLIQGVVMVVFVVETDGSVSQVNVTRRIGGGCDEEAIRVTREMPRWEPGKRNGRPVRVLVRMPIVFRIPGRGM